MDVIPGLNLPYNKIYLGSQSPRRKEILEATQIPFEVIISEEEETYPRELSLDLVPQFLAEQKANFISKKIVVPNYLLITADTVVLLENQILGKPNDKSEAKAILQLLSGKMHTVVTGVCLKEEKGVLNTFSCCTKVYFNTLTLEEIDFFVENYNPIDKAGAYAIQEWIGYIGIHKIEGCYYNVMGLPISSIITCLKSRFLKLK